MLLLSLSMTVGVLSFLLKIWFNKLIFLLIAVLGIALTLFGIAYLIYIRDHCANQVAQHRIMSIAIYKTYRSKDDISCQIAWQNALEFNKDIAEEQVIAKNFWLHDFYTDEFMTLQPISLPHRSE